MVGVTRNDDWTPFEQDFDGVPMVLVPKGCYLMGSDSGDSDEQPVAQQCIDDPFWLDKYEVSNAAYGSTASGGCTPYSSEPDQPRICISWFIARDFCESRGGRLPTEREWEFAARGPDGLVYPWGTDFVADNVVYGSNSGSKTAPVGSRPGGVSWVGALDLSGNVWEWVSSLFLPYPYDASQAEDSENANSTRVLRGGSWNDLGSDVRGADRGRDFPYHVNYFFGLRCARSYNSES